MAPKLVFDCGASKSSVRSDFTLIPTSGILRRTWSQKLSSGLTLVTSVTTHLFQTALLVLCVRSEMRPPVCASFSTASRWYAEGQWSLRGHRLFLLSVHRARALRYGRRPGQPSSSSLARRVCVHFEYALTDDLRYVKAPGIFCGAEWRCRERVAV